MNINSEPIHQHTRVGDGCCDHRSGAPFDQSAMKAPMINRRHRSEVQLGQSSVEAPFGGTVWSISDGGAVERPMTKRKNV